MKEQKYLSRSGFLLIAVDAIGGHVEATCHSLAGVKPHVDARKMRILLINHKMDAFPVPTITYQRPKITPGAGGKEEKQDHSRTDERLRIGQEGDRIEFDKHIRF